MKVKTQKVYTLTHEELKRFIHLHNVNIKELPPTSSAKQHDTIIELTMKQMLKELAND